MHEARNTTSVQFIRPAEISICLDVYAMVRDPTTKGAARIASNADDLAKDRACGLVAAI